MPRSPRVDHPPERPLQVDRLRRGPLDVGGLPADDLGDRAEQPALDAPPARGSSGRRNAVVVLPLVPVTPTIFSSALGSPNQRDAIGAIARRESATTSCGTSRSSSRSVDQGRGAGLDQRPVRSRDRRRRAPVTQKNRVPGRTSRLSKATSVISADPSPRTIRRALPLALRARKHRGAELVEPHHRRF